MNFPGQFFSVFLRVLCVFVVKKKVAVHGVNFHCRTCSWPLVPRLCLGMRFKRLCLLFERNWLPPVPMLPVIKPGARNFPTFLYRRQSLRVCIPRQSLGTRAGGGAWKIKNITPVNGYLFFYHKDTKNTEKSRKK